MRIPPPDHLALLLRTRDGGYVYDTLKELAGSADRPNLADTEMALAERDDELSLLAIATFGYSVPAVQRAYQRAASDLVRQSAAGNGFAPGSGWCGSVLDLEQAGQLLRASPNAISAFAANPRIAPDGLRSLLGGLGPAATASVRDHLAVLYAALANNPSIPKMIAAVSGSTPPAPVVQALLSSLAGCPVDPVHAEAARSLLQSIWRQVDTNVTLPPPETLAAIAHWRAAPDGGHTGAAAFEVQQYLWALSDLPKPTPRDDMAKRVGAMMRLVMQQGDEATLKLLYQIDSHAFYCALNHTPIARFRESTRQVILGMLRSSPSDHAAFIQVHQAILDDGSTEAMLRPVTRGEFLSTSEWLDSIVREMAPSLNVILNRAVADRKEGNDLSKLYTLMLAAFGVVALAGLIMAIFVLVER